MTELDNEGRLAPSSSWLQQQGSNLGRRTLPTPVPPLDRLCDDLLILILACVSSRGQSPSDLVSATLTCRRLYKLGRQPEVLANAGRQTVAVKARKWCPQARRFLTQCAASGNMEATFILGMIEFYCLDDKGKGMNLLMAAARASHGEALLELAVLQMNGSAGRRNPVAGVALLAKAAMEGCMEATRELGHCVKAGEGVDRADSEEGRRLVKEANRRDAIVCLRGGDERESEKGAENLSGWPLPLMWLLHRRLHPARRFLVEWRLLLNGGTRPSARKFERRRYCSSALCGRSETRPREFRQCAACFAVFYCSRSCQSVDWKLRHVLHCLPPFVPSVRP